MSAKLVSIEDVRLLMEDRPFKYHPAEVRYEQAPEGSAMRCAACFHLYRRATDGHAVCELIRDDKIDAEGIRPDFRCLYFSADGDVFPLLEED